MQFAMMSPAQWHRELVAHLAAERAVLRKAQMMGIAAGRDCRRGWPRCAGSQRRRWQTAQNAMAPATATTCGCASVSLVQILLRLGKGEDDNPSHFTTPEPSERLEITTCSIARAAW